MNGLEFKTAVLARPVGRVEEDSDGRRVGIVEALVAVTGIEDDVNDVIIPGAFARTLIERPRPKVCLGHDWNRPIGKTLDIKELMPGDSLLPRHTADGDPWPAEAGAVWAKCQYNLDTDDGLAAYKDALFQGNAGTRFSIGYRTRRFERKGRTRYIGDLDLWEYSQVLSPANRLAAMVSIKSVIGGELETRVNSDSLDVMEIKARYVRDADYWGMPKGTPIKPGMKPRGPKARKRAAGGKATPETRGAVEVRDGDVKLKVTAKGKAKRNDGAYESAILGGFLRDARGDSTPLGVDGDALVVDDNGEYTRGDKVAPKVGEYNPLDMLIANAVVPSDLEETLRSWHEQGEWDERIGDSQEPKRAKQIDAYITDVMDEYRERYNAALVDQRAPSRKPTKPKGKGRAAEVDALALDAEKLEVDEIDDDDEIEADAKRIVNGLNSDLPGWDDAKADAVVAALADADAADQTRFLEGMVARAKARAAGDDEPDITVSENGGVPKKLAALLPDGDAKPEGKLSGELATRLRDDLAKTPGATLGNRLVDIAPEGQAGIEIRGVASMLNSDYTRTRRGGKPKARITPERNAERSRDNFKLTDEQVIESADALDALAEAVESLGLDEGDRGDGFGGVVEYSRRTAAAYRALVDDSPTADDLRTEDATTPGMWRSKPLQAVNALPSTMREEYRKAGNNVKRAYENRRTVGDDHATAMASARATVARARGSVDNIPRPVEPAADAPDIPVHPMAGDPLAYRKLGDQVLQNQFDAYREDERKKKHVEQLARVEVAEQIARDAPVAITDPGDGVPVGNGRLIGTDLGKASWALRTADGKILARSVDFATPDNSRRSVKLNRKQADSLAQALAAITNRNGDRIPFTAPDTSTWARGFYTADGDDAQSAIKRALIDWADANGFEVDPTRRRPTVDRSWMRRPVPLEPGTPDENGFYHSEPPKFVSVGDTIKTWDGTEGVVTDIQQSRTYDARAGASRERTTYTLDNGTTFTPSDISGTIPGVKYANGRPDPAANTLMPGMGDEAGRRLGKSATDGDADRQMVAYAERALPAGTRVYMPRDDRDDLLRGEFADNRPIVGVTTDRFLWVGAVGDYFQVVDLDDGTSTAVHTPNLVKKPDEFVVNPTVEQVNRARVAWGLPPVDTTSAPRRRDAPESTTPEATAPEADTPRRPTPEAPAAEPERAAPPAVEPERPAVAEPEAARPEPPTRPYEVVRKPTKKNPVATVRFNGVEYEVRQESRGSRVPPRIAVTAPDGTVTEVDADERTATSRVLSARRSQAVENAVRAALLQAEGGHRVRGARPTTPPLTYQQESLLRNGRRRRVTVRVDDQDGQPAWEERDALVAHGHGTSALPLLRSGLITEVRDDPRMYALTPEGERIAAQLGPDPDPDRQPDRTTAAMWRNNAANARERLVPHRQEQYDALDGRAKAAYEQRRAEGQTHADALNAARADVTPAVDAPEERATSASAPDNVAADALTPEQRSLLATARPRQVSVAAEERRASVARARADVAEPLIRSGLIERTSVPDNYALTPEGERVASRLDPDPEQPDRTNAARWTVNPDAAYERLSTPRRQQVDDLDDDQRAEYVRRRAAGDNHVDALVAARAVEPPLSASTSERSARILSTDDVLDRLNAIIDVSEDNTRARNVAETVARAVREGDVTFAFSPDVAPGLYAMSPPSHVRGQPWNVMTGSGTSVPIRNMAPFDKALQDTRLPKSAKRVRLLMDALSEIRDADGNPPPWGEMTNAWATTWRDRDGSSLPDAIQGRAVPAYLRAIGSDKDAEKIEREYADRLAARRADDADRPAPPAPPARNETQERADARQAAREERDRAERERVARLLAERGGRRGIRPPAQPEPEPEEITPDDTVTIEPDELDEVEAVRAEVLSLSETADGDLEVTEEVAQRQDRVEALVRASTAGELDLAARATEQLQADRVDLRDELRLQTEIARRDRANSRPNRLTQVAQAAARAADPDLPRVRPGLAGAAQDHAEALESGDADAIARTRARLDSSLRRSRADSDAARAMADALRDGTTAVELNDYAGRLRAETRERRNAAARRRRAVKRIERDRIRSLLGQVDAEIRTRETGRADGDRATTSGDDRIVITPAVIPTVAADEPAANDGGDEPWSDTEMAISELNSMRIKTDNLDREFVTQLAERYRKEGYRDKPIQVEKTNKDDIVTDGHHRLAAAEEAGLTSLPVRVFDNSTAGRSAANRAMMNAEAAKEEGASGVRATPDPDDGGGSTERGSALAQRMNDEPWLLLGADVVAGGSDADRRREIARRHFGPVAEEYASILATVTNRELDTTMRKLDGLDIGNTPTDMLAVVIADKLDDDGRERFRRMMRRAGDAYTRDVATARRTGRDLGDADLPTAATVEPARAGHRGRLDLMAGPTLASRPLGESPFETLDDALGWLGAQQPDSDPNVTDDYDRKRFTAERDQLVADIRAAGANAYLSPGGGLIAFRSRHKNHRGRTTWNVVHSVSGRQLGHFGGEGRFGTGANKFGGSTPAGMVDLDGPAMRRMLDALERQQSGNGQQIDWTQDEAAVDGQVRDWQDFGLNGVLYPIGTERLDGGKAPGLTRSATAYAVAENPRKYAGTSAFQSLTMYGNPHDVNGREGGHSLNQSFANALSDMNFGRINRQYGTDQRTPDDLRRDKLTSQIVSEAQVKAFGGRPHEAYEQLRARLAEVEESSRDPRSGHVRSYNSVAYLSDAIPELFSPADREVDRLGRVGEGDFVATVRTDYNREAGRWEAIPDGPPDHVWEVLESPRESANQGGDSTSFLRVRRDDGLEGTLTIRRGGRAREFSAEIQHEGESSRAHAFTSGSGNSWAVFTAAEGRPATNAEVVTASWRARDAFLAEGADRPSPDAPAGQLAAPSAPEVDEPVRAPEPAGQLASLDGDLPGSTEDRVKAAYAKLSQKPQDWVRLAKLRAELPDVDRAELDAFLRKQILTGEWHLAPDSNRKVLTDEDHAAAIRVGSEDKHLLAIEADG